MQTRGQLETLETRVVLSNTALVWTVGVPLPSPRADAAALTLNGETIVADGATPGPTKTVVENAPTSSSWVSLPNDDTGRVGPGFVSPPSGLLIYGGAGGSQGTIPSNSAFLYDITGQNSESAPDMMSPRMQFAHAADGTGQAYAIGGVDDAGKSLATVERFNATSMSWATVAALPAARCGAVAAFDGSGAIYVVGGSPTAGDTTGANTLYKYNVSTNQWTALASLPYTVRDAAAVFAPDGKLDVLGGISGGAAVASVETYDPATDTWATNTSLPAAISSAAAVVDGAGRIEVIGGYDASQQPLAQVELSQVVNNPVGAPGFTTTPATASLTVASGSTFTYAAAASGNPLANFAITTGPAGMTIDPVNGHLSWATPASFVGPAAVTITATNPLGSVSQSFNLNVVDKTPPTTPGKPALTAETATSVTLSWAPSTDNVGVTGYAVYWIYTTGHSGRGGGITTHVILEATTNGATSVTIGGLLQGHSYSLYVQAHDAAGNKSAYSAPISVIPGAAPYGFQAFQAGYAVYQASDLANHQLDLQLKSTSFSPPVYSALNAPAGMSVDPNTGVVNWLPGASNLGTTSVTFQATNQFGTTSLIISIVVTPDYPVPDIVFTNTLSPTFDIIGQPVSAKLVDHSNTPSMFSVVSGPAGLTVDPVSGVLNWTPTPDQAGNSPETFQLTNAFGSRTLSTGIVIYVASPPQNVTATGLDTSSPVLNWQPPAYNANLVARYNINIFGGGLGGQAGYTFSTGGANLSASLAGIITAGQTYQVNIQALDAAGRQGLWNTSLSFTYNPASPSDGPLAGTPVPLTATEGNAATGAVASFTDGNFSGPASNFTALINWGDGSSATTATVSGAGGAYTISGSHAYAAGGQTLPLTVVVNDTDGSKITVGSSAIVVDAPLTGTGATIAATEGSAFTGAVASFTDANPLAQPGDFIATIDWGDGSSTTTATVSGAGGAYTISGSHTYADGGQTLPLTVVVTDADGSKITVGSSAIVADAPLTGAGATIAATEGGTFTGAVASFTDANPSAQTGNFTALIDWGDGSSATTATVGGANGAYTVSGAHTYTEGGQTLPITVVVNDTNGSTVTVGSLAIVADAPLTGTGATIAATERSTFTAVVASFTDANPSAQSGNFTATIDWGDGQTSAGTAAASTGAFSVTGTHDYAHAGTFVVQATVTDEGHLTVLTGNAVVAISSDVQHVQYVTSVYGDVLGRAPDAAGLAYWTEQLGHGAAKSSVAAAIAHSDEYYANFVVKPDYLKLLGRAADDAGVRYWTAQLDHSATDQQLEADLVSSDEFFRAAGGTNLKWLDAIYTLLLGRAADAAGEHYWVAQLEHGETLNQVAQTIAGGHENNAQLINADYLRYLGRSTDPAGLSYWLNEFSLGRTNEDIVAGFTGSDEYYQRHTG